MSDILPFAQPLQRRLTKMYTDTKSSLAFVTNGAREDAELSALHRKLRIQKDRLMTWGLRWSEASEVAVSGAHGDADPSAPPPRYDDIDESLSQAGLADVVGSIMGTIKDILAEAEPLWAASGSAEVRPMPRAAEKAIEARAPLVVWDKRRFEDLVADLTSSIDTLYDISRMRQGGLANTKKSGKKLEIVIEEEAAFEKARIETPQLVDPSSLSGRNGVNIVGESGLRVEGSRHLLYLTQEASSTTGPLYLPVLLEFAVYDPIYAMTGIGPGMKRFEKLFAGLQRGKEEAGKPDFGVLNLIGYFEDAENNRFGLVYELPGRCGDISLPSSVKPEPYDTTLASLISLHSLEPALEVKYRLAYNLATSVFDLHSKGVVHGSLTASNIAFVELYRPHVDRLNRLAHVNIRRPYLTGYDLFPEAASEPPESGESSESAESETVWYRHELDPRQTPHTTLTTESRSLDLYSLAILLLEIGLWGLSREMRQGVSGSGIALNFKTDRATAYKELAARCGTAYQRAVEACLRAIDDEMGAMGANTRPDVTLQKVYGRVLRSLEKCCSIEDEEEEEDAEVGVLLVIMFLCSQNRSLLLSQRPRRQSRSWTRRRRKRSLTRRRQMPLG